ncbi:MAG: phosphatidylglycerol lysyltransferase domain-containing protein [Tissierellia bacterium]|nr:phosphatidylglycerol lysyltransferase domain-containing protein [Tissierellia bacterium]MDD4781538.1 phosphatidylglycerol lysyltransferase domain-containing protein [Tissierellia bacterium]
MHFKSLSLEDKDIINKYSKNSNLESYEYLFSSLYMWRKLNNVKYTIIDGVLVIEKNEEGKGTFYAQPLGYSKDNLVNIIELLLKRNENYTDREYLFGDVDDNFINDLKEYTDYNIEVIEDIDDFEYVYKTQDLIELRGRKYHGKKNHVNSFEKTYDYEIKTIDNKYVMKDCINLLHKWHEEVLETVDREMCMEIDAIRDVFKEIHELDLKTIAVYVNDELAGFAIGELVNDKLAVIHAERGEIQYKGIYAFLNKKFLMESFSETEFVNRQEDTGNEGLRKAKQSYHPTKMVKKYLVKL